MKLFQAFTVLSVFFVLTQAYIPLLPHAEAMSRSVAGSFLMLRIPTFELASLTHIIVSVDFRHIHKEDFFGGMVGESSKSRHSRW